MTDLVAERFIDVYAEIGQLTMWFARIEVAMATKLKERLGTSETIAKAIVGNKRIDDIVRLFRDVLVAIAVCEEAIVHFDDLVKEIWRVKAIRNIVAHRSFHLSGEGDDQKICFEFSNNRNDKQNAFYYLSLEELVAVRVHASTLSMRVYYLIDQTIAGTLNPALEVTKELLRKPTLPKPPQGLSPDRA